MIGYWIRITCPCFWLSISYYGLLLNSPGCFEFGFIWSQQWSVSLLPDNRSSSFTCLVHQCWILVVIGAWSMVLMGRPVLTHFVFHIGWLFKTRKVLFLLYFKNRKWRIRRILKIIAIIWFFSHYACGTISVNFLPFPLK